MFEKGPSLRSGVTGGCFLPSLGRLMLAELTRDASAGELSRGQVERAMAALLDPATGDEARANFLRAWTQRGETARELADCAESLLPRAADPGVRGTWNGRRLLDCCGTGGGGLNLLNISTGIVFILAAMGVPVVKHGNRGLTKKSGSADVLEALGIRIDPPPEKLRPCLEQVGAAFLFAPAYHTSFSVLRPVRQRLGAEGRRTVFNLLGPLLNPARPEARMVGVFTEKNVALYDETLRHLGCARYSVVCGIFVPGEVSLGEVSPHGRTEIRGTLQDGNGRPFEKLPWRFQKIGDPDLNSIIVTTAEESARLLLAVLKGEESGLAREALLINATMAAWTQGNAPTFEESHEQASEALDSGRALDVLSNWQNFSKSA